MRAAESAGAPVEVRITSVVHGGEGIGRLSDGQVVFVPLAAPGDLVRARVDRSRRPARGRILQLLEPGPGRVEPACSAFGRCGGCDLMHLGADARREIALSLARETLRAGGPEPVFHASDAPLGYRERARLSLRGGVLGHRARSSRDVVPAERCEILAPPLEAARRELERALPRTLAEVHLGPGGGGRVVCALETEDLEPSTPGTLDRLVRAGVVAGVRVLLRGASAPLDFGDPLQRFEGADGAPLVVPPLGFAQPSSRGAAALARLVHDLALATAPERLLELFSGSGTLSVLLARSAQLECVESDEAAVRCARQNLAARGLPARVSPGDAEQLPIPPWARVVVLDPPRTGARGAARALVDSRARAVVYVSCDAPTFARDARVLEAGGFRVDTLHVVELFPQTSHFELVARLVR